MKINVKLLEKIIEEETTAVMESIKVKVKKGLTEQPVVDPSLAQSRTAPGGKTVYGGEDTSQMFQYVDAGDKYIVQVPMNVGEEPNVNDPKTVADVKNQGSLFLQQQIGGKQVPPESIGYMPDTEIGAYKLTISKAAVGATPATTATAQTAAPPTAAATPAPARKPMRPDPTVTKIQEHLIKFPEIAMILGKTGPNKNGVDGIYGPKTAQAVKAFFAGWLKGSTMPKTYPEILKMILTVPPLELPNIPNKTGQTGQTGQTGAATGWSIMDLASELPALVQKAVDLLDPPATTADLQAFNTLLDQLNKKLVDEDGDGEGDKPAIEKFEERYSEEESGDTIDGDLLSLAGENPNAFAQIGAASRGGQGRDIINLIRSKISRMKQDGQKWKQSKLPAGAVPSPAPAGLTGKVEYDFFGNPRQVAGSAARPAAAAPATPAVGGAGAAVANAKANLQENKINISKQYLKQVIQEELSKELKKKF